MLRVRREEIEAEVAAVEAELVAHMERAATAEIRLEDGVLRLVQEEGAPPALAWETAPKAPEAGGRNGPSA
jgi:hypothetical protein